MEIPTFIRGDRDGLKPNVRSVLSPYSLVALALAGALRFTPQLPDPERKPAEVFAAQAATPSWKLRFDTLARGESLHSLLRRGGLDDTSATRALQAATALDQRRIPAGMPVTIRSEASDSTPSEVTLQLSIDRLLHLRRSGDAWAGTEERLPWTTDTCHRQRHRSTSDTSAPRWISAPKMTCPRAPVSNFA